MKKTMQSLILSFLLLMGSNAFALEGKKNTNFLEKMEISLNETQAKVLGEISDSTDIELMETYGDVLLELIFNDSALIHETGISQDKSIRENVELLYSDDAKEFMLNSAEAKLTEFGSLKAFKKAAKKQEKSLKKNQKGLGRALTVVVSYITLPFFMIFGPWGWVYWLVLFGYWS